MTDDFEDNNERWIKIVKYLTKYELLRYYGINMNMSIKTLEFHILAHS